MIIREADTGEADTALDIVRSAFGRDDEVNLTKALFEDESAKPSLSLLAFQAGEAVGHILFTTVCIENQSALHASLLAPLSVKPEHQGKGIGKALVKYGMEELSDAGVDAVFVLGHPSYYPTMGFQPAGPLGYEMPFPLPEGPPNAWMMRPIRPNIPEGINGPVIVPDALNKPEYWRE